jgi:predicted amidohydrolase YtcJ
MTKQWDLVLKNVRIVRPGQREPQVGDVAIRGGKFARVGGA